MKRRKEEVEKKLAEMHFAAREARMESTRLEIDAEEWLTAASSAKDMNRAKYDELMKKYAKANEKSWELYPFARKTEDEIDELTWMMEGIVIPEHLEKLFQ